MALKDNISREDLEKFYVLFGETFSNLEGLSAEHRPARALQALKEKFPGKYSKILRMGVSDCVEKAADWNRDKIKAVDDFFRERGVVTLSLVTAAFKKKFEKIIERGEISSDDEFYLLKAVLPDIRDKETETRVIRVLDEYEKI